MDYVPPWIDPKLARGLVREELRPLKKRAEQSIHQRLGKKIAALTHKHIKPGKTISNSTATKVRDTLYRGAAQELKPILEYRHRIPLDDDSTIRRETRSFLYWFMTKQEVYKNLEAAAADYSADFLELRLERYGVDRRKVIMDDYFCNVSVSDHALIRMLERGAVERSPLLALSNDIERILTFASIYSILYIARPNKYSPSVIIPFGPGALLCKIGELREDDSIKGGYHSRFRIQSDARQTKTMEIPYPAFFNPQKAARPATRLVQISTFVGNMELAFEQAWAVEQLNSLMDRDADKLIHYQNMIISPDSLDDDSADSVTHIIGELEELFSKPKWKIATTGSL